MQFNVVYLDGWDIFGALNGVESCEIVLQGGNQIVYTSKKVGLPTTNSSIGQQGKLTRYPLTGNLCGNEKSYITTKTAIQFLLHFLSLKHMHTFLNILSNVASLLACLDTSEITEWWSNTCRKMYVKTCYAGECPMDGLIPSTYRRCLVPSSLSVD